MQKTKMKKSAQAVRTTAQKPKNSPKKSARKENAPGGGGGGGDIKLKIES